MCALALSCVSAFARFRLLRCGWELEAAYQAWAEGPARAAHAAGGAGGSGARPNESAKPVATGASLLEFEVVQQTTGLTR
jgi:heme-degrading monooxygenase HmoA